MGQLFPWNFHTNCKPRILWWNEFTFEGKNSLRYISSNFCIPFLQSFWDQGEGGTTKQVLNNFSQPTNTARYRFQKQVSHDIKDCQVASYRTPSRISSKKKNVVLVALHSKYRCIQSAVYSGLVQQFPSRPRYLPPIHLS